MEGPLRSFISLRGVPCDVSNYSGKRQLQILGDKCMYGGRYHGILCAYPCHQCVTQQSLRGHFT